MTQQYYWFDDPRRQGNPAVAPPNPFNPQFGGQAPPPSGSMTTPLTSAYQQPAAGGLRPDAFSTWQQGNAPQNWANPQGMPAQPAAPPTAQPGAVRQPTPQMPSPQTYATDYGQWALPGGWDGSKNKYSFNLNTKAWTNPGNMLYMYGYNQAKDGAKIPTAQGNETEFNRVYAFMNAVARANGVSDISQAPEALQKYAMNYAVGRLKTDYFNSDPTGNGWRNSAFAGFDANQNAPGGMNPTSAPAPQRPPLQIDPNTGAATHTPGAPGVIEDSTNPFPPGTAAHDAYEKGHARPGTTPGAPLPPGYQGTGGGGGNLTPAQRMALASDPNQAYRYMMQQIGYNPDAPGLLGRFLEQRFKPLLEARMAASGLEGASAQDGQLSSSYMDRIGETIGDFGAGAFGRGGNLGGGGGFFQNLTNLGNSAAHNASGVLGELKDQSQAMQYLQQLGSLRYAGANPLVQQSAADVMQRGQNRYQDYAFNNELAGKNIDPFTRWLLEQSQYRGIYGL